MAGARLVLAALSTAILAAFATAGAGAVAAETLTVTVSGKGKVTSTPRGIACPPKCRLALPKGKSVKLAARPSAGWKFAGWAGGCRSQTNPNCIVWLRTAKRVQARFAANPPPPPPPAPPRPAFTPQTLAGTWSGTWRNTTFGSTGPASIRFQVTSATAFVFTLNIGGSVFGCPPPPPVTGTVNAGTGPNTWSASGFSVQTTGPLGGTITVAYDDRTQTLTGNGRSGCRPELTWELRGTFTGNTFSGTMAILSGGTAFATSEVTLTRPAPP